MKLKQLQGYLEGLETFTSPNIQLEQYQTGPEIAANLLYHFAHMTYEDIEDRTVLDLGCGCGTFSIGSRLMGARYAMGVDIDESALQICSTNLEELEVDNVDLICANVSQLSDGVLSRAARNSFDTIIMNPPFGTRQSGIDMIFLSVAVTLAMRAVYSFHKTSTREHIAKQLEKWEIPGEPISQVKFDLPKSYGFHRKASKDIEVDLWRVDTSSTRHPLNLLND